MVEIPKPGKIKNLILKGDFTKLTVYIVTGVSIALFLILALLSFFNIIGFGSLSDFLIFAILSGTGIYGMYEFLHFKRRAGDRVAAQIDGLLLHWQLSPSLGYRLKRTRMPAALYSKSSTVASGCPPGLSKQN